MDDGSRRGFLSGAGGVLTAGLLSGCASPDRATTPNEPDTVGDVAAVRGIEITFRDYSLHSELSYVPRRDDEVTVADDAADRDAVTIGPGPDRQFLVVIVDIANAADEPKGVPIPGGSAFADGDIYLEVNQSRRDPVPVDPRGGDAVGGAYRYEEEWIDRLTLAVGTYQSELPANTTVRGWTLYEVPSDFDAGEARLFATANPEGSEQQYTWEFTNN